MMTYLIHMNWDSVDRERLDVGTATGMRLLAAEAAAAMLSADLPSTHAPLLKRHIPVSYTHLTLPTKA